MVVNCLLAGTRMRGKTFEEDEAFEVDFLVDEKECVEYVMFVDFGWNDVGCVFKVGMVKVEKFMEIECYFYVMYIFFIVTGNLVDDFGSWDVFCVVLFVGIVSGVLKVCVM